jgi:hypothetical protein
MSAKKMEAKTRRVDATVLLLLHLYDTYTAAVDRARQKDQLATTLR